MEDDAKYGSLLYGKLHRELLHIAIHEKYSKEAMSLYEWLLCKCQSDNWQTLYGSLVGSRRQGDKYLPSRHVLFS